MSLTISNICGFETGGLEEAYATAGSPTIETSNVRTDLRSLKLVSGDAYELLAPNASGPALFGVGFATDDATPAAVRTIVEGRSGSGTLEFLLYLLGNGKIALYCYGNYTQYDSTWFWPDTDYHYIEIYYKLADSPDGEFEVFVDGVSRISASGIDTKLGASDALQRTNLKGAAENFYFDDWYGGLCDSAADRLSNGAGDPYVQVFGQQSGDPDETPDIGTALDYGSPNPWEYAGRTPTDSNTIGYEDGGTVYGVVLCNDSQSGDHYRPGPSERSLSGAIVCAKWGWLIYRGNGGATDHFGVYGNDGDQNYNVTVDLDPATSPAQWFQFISTSGLFMPTTSEHFGIGIWKGSGGQEMYCEDMWAFVLHVPSTGTIQYKSLAGALAPAGVAGRWPMVARAGSLTPAGALPLRQTFVTRQGTLPSAGAVARKTSVDYGGTLTPTGVGSGVLLAVQAVGGVLGSAGGLVRQTYVDYAGVLTPTGLVTRWPKVLRAGTLGLAGAVATVFTQFKTLTGGLTPTGVATGVLLAVQSVAGSLTPAGAVVRKPLKALAGALAPTGDIVAKALKALAGALAPTGDLDAEKLAGIVYKAVGGVLTPTGVVVRWPFKMVGGTLGAAGAVLRNTMVPMAGGLTPTGAVTRSWQTFKAVAGTLTPTGALATAALLLQAVGGTLGLAGVVTRYAKKGLAGTLGAAGGLGRSIGKAIGGVLGAIGALVANFIPPDQITIELEASYEDTLALAASHLFVLPAIPEFISLGGSYADTIELEASYGD